MRLSLGAIGVDISRTRRAAGEHDGRDVALIIGGADGIDPAFKQTADEAIRLSERPEEAAD